MKVFYNVHIKNYEVFVEYLLNRYNNFGDINLYSYRSYYKENIDYLYLCITFSNIYDEYILSYMDFNTTDRKWLNNNGWKYIGEYLSRKDKLERLNNLSNEDI